MHSLFIKIKYFLNIKIYSWHYCKLCGVLNGKLICNDCFSILSKVALDIIPVTDNWFFDKLYPSFVYQNPLPKVLHKFKYGKNLSLSWSLGYLLYSNLKNLDMDSIDYIIPVPIHPLKKKKRGFNQVLRMLDYYIAYSNKIPVRLDIVSKTRQSHTQVNSSFSERAKNVYNTFQILKNVQNKRILIVDDVFTTGATVNELSRILKEAGATKVEIYCLMRV
jgi:competence protein ComFC